jgi:hypothetical protein
MESTKSVREWKSYAPRHFFGESYLTGGVSCEITLLYGPNGRHGNLEAPSPIPYNKFNNHK